MNLRTWYGSSVRIPDFLNAGYPLFAASCLGLINSILKKRLDKQVNIVFSKIDTAAANQTTSTIHINHEFLLGKILGLELEAPEALTVIMGAVVHEAAHFAWTPATLEPFVDYVRSHRTSKLFLKDLAFSLANIVEDIYIEAEVGRTVPGLVWLLEYLNSLFFSEKRAETALLSVKGIEQQPMSMQDVVTLTSALILAKTRESSQVNQFFDSLFEMARSAVDMPELKQRLVLTCQIYDMLMAKVEEIEQELSCLGNGNDGDGEPKSGGIEVILQELLDSVKGVTVGGDMKTPVGSGTQSQLTMAVKNRLDVFDNSELTRNEEQGTSAPFMSYYLEKTVFAEKTTVEMDTRYIRLAELGRQTATTNRPYGNDRTRGHNIRRLWRIATDNKIFAEPVQMSDYKPFEVIILMDNSGSMNMPVGLYGPTRKQLAAKAVYGAAYGLTEARCSVAVYAHSASLFNLDEVNIFMLKTFTEPVSILGNRLQGLIEQSISGDNRDGYAISYVAKKFRTTSRKRILIVISDGYPNANYYKGQTGIDHSKQSVDRLHAQGIEVLSISITKESVAANNRIYGERNNIYNQDPAVIEWIIRRYLGQ